MLGQTLATEDSELIGRVVNVNLATLSGDVKRQSVSLRFRISTVKDSKAYADVISYHTSGAAIRRFVRRNVNRIDLSTVCQTSDNVKLRVKVFILTKSKTSGSVMHGLQKTCLELLAKEVAKMEYGEFVWSLIEHKTQSELRKALSKIYPIKTFEIKMFNLLRGEHEAKPSKEKAPAKVDKSAE
jgi:ribosomal protein S3AE